MRKDHRLDPTDLIYFPATFLCSYVLSRWLPFATATALAVMLVLSIIHLLTRATGTDKKGFIVPVLVAGVITFILGLIGWPL